MSAAARRSRLLRTHLERLVRASKGVARGDVRALHRARVATRRLRELVPLLQLDGDTARKLGRRLRRVTRQLGAVREPDVLLLLVDELHASRRASGEAVARVGMAVARERDAARERLVERPPAETIGRLAVKLGNAADRLDVDDASASRTVRWAIDARIARRAVRLADGLREAGAVYLPERLHAARIAVKKLRYVLELAGELTGADHRGDVRILKRAQDALGRMHDLQMLIERVRRVQATLTPPNVTVWRGLDDLVKRLDEDCRRLHARYLRLRPELDAIASRRSGSGFGVRGSSFRVPKAREPRRVVR